MNQKQIKAAVEAMLFAAGDPVSADKLAAAVQLPQTTVETALEDLRVRYAREDSGLCLLHLDTRWQLATKTEWADCIRRLLDARRSVPLGPAAMETLTVIAYNQPVSRAFIEQVRGVDSSSSVSGLLGGRYRAWAAARADFLAISSASVTNPRSPQINGPVLLQCSHFA